MKKIKIEYDCGTRMVAVPSLEICDGLIVIPQTTINSDGEVVCSDKGGASFVVHHVKTGRVAAHAKSLEGAIAAAKKFKKLPIDWANVSAAQLAKKHAQLMPKLKQIRDEAMPRYWGSRA